MIQTSQARREGVATGLRDVGCLTANSSQNSPGHFPPQANFARKFHDASAREVFRCLGGKRLTNGSFLVHCPVPSHGKGSGDKAPSLSVANGRDGRLLVHCHAGCEALGVLAALRARGMAGRRVS